MKPLAAPTQKTPYSPAKTIEIEPGKHATHEHCPASILSWPPGPAIVAGMAALLSPELKSFVAQRYIAAGRTPAELVVELKADFDVTITPGQLRQFLSRSGLSARKAEVAAKVCALVSPAAANKIAKDRAAAPLAQLEKWSGRAVAAADRAFDAAEQSGRPRDLASAISAASTAVRMFRACMGLDDGSPRATTNYNYNFASIKVRPVGQPEEAVDVAANETSEGAE